MPNVGLTNSQVLEYIGLPQETTTQLLTAQGNEFKAHANEFLSALTNKILYQTVDSMEFDSPFNRFDGFPINYGDTIENIFVEMPKGYTFDKDATDPFTKSVPSVKTLYAMLNYDLQYATTVEDALLRRACLSEYGFMNIINQIIAQLAKSMDLDKYFATITMLDNPDIYAHGVEKVTYDSGATDSQKAELMTKTIINAVSKFKLPMTTNNKMGVLQTSKVSDVLLIIKDTLLNSINLDYLTGVYNLSKVDLVKNIISVDKFTYNMEQDGTVTEAGTDIDFVIIDTKAFDIHKALQDGGMIYNPKGKYTNHFYNLWMCMSFKYFYNARAFKLTENA